MDPHDISHITLILAASFLGGLFLKRLRQPVMVGYIIAGVILGPSVLGIAQTTETIQWLAELGIVLLMFMIGLELDMKVFRESLATALSVVLMQVTVAVSAMLFLSIFFNTELGFSVLIGCAIALSSTAVAINVLKDLRQEHTEAGKLTTSILVAQDLAVIPMLILIQLVSGESINTAHFIKAGISIALVVITLGGIFYMSRHPRMLRRVSAVFSHGVDQPALAATAFVFTAAAISGFAGLSSAYGAFALGLILRNVSTIGDTYKKAIEPLHDLLLMIFFLSIGFILNVDVIVEHAFLIGALLFVVVVLKTIGNTLMLSGTQLSLRGKLLSGAALSQIGEFSFVLLGVGIENGTISLPQYQIGLSVIALTLVVSPLWIGLVRYITGIRTIASFTHERGSTSWRAFKSVAREVTHETHIRRK
jgi:CPA2 family monovalent cation:H+ antiporter-2